jgi:nucleoside-diphosphate-sugar epimerase
MKIFVTGSAGFIGGKLVKYFQSQGHNVVHPVRSELNLADFNQVDKFFDEQNIDVVVHCAVAGRTNMSGQDLAISGENVIMIRNLYSNKHKFKRLVNVASGYEFDHINNNVDLIPEHEIENIFPQASYGMGKNIVSRIVRGVDDWVNLRLFGMFHEDESDARIFKKLKSGTGPFTIDADRQFDFVYLEDTLPMFDLAIEGKLHHKCINLVYPEKYYMGELIKYFCEVNNVDREVIVKSVGDKNYTGAYNRWQDYEYPRVGLKEALKRYSN